MATKMKIKPKKPARKAQKAATPVKKRLTKAQQLQREIARRNKLFEKAGMAEKRVLIAQDVIAQLKAKRLKAEQGTWTDMSGSDVVRLDVDGSFQQTFLEHKGVQCQCCAVGSLFIGCALFANKISNGEIRDNWELGEHLFAKRRFDNGFDKIFSRKQLGLIEIAFEGSTNFFDDNDWTGVEAASASRKEQDAAYDFYSRYSDASAKETLTAIMENIVENKGTFKP